MRNPASSFRSLSLGVFVSLVGGALSSSACSGSSATPGDAGPPPVDPPLDAGTGEDIVFGGAGNDTIYGGPDPDVICYNFKASDISFSYNGSDYSIWVDAPDGSDHIFTALTIATTTGTYRFDVPTQTWNFDASMTTADWMAMKL